MPYDPFALVNDPFAEIERRRKETLAGGSASARDGSAVPPLPAADAESLLTKAANTGLGALHYVGGSLEKAVGGRAIRGVLGGKPREALSIIPFSDFAHLTDESDRVSGEDLLKQWGALRGDGQKGTFEMRDLAGPALEVAIDPATYLSFGTSAALTKAGLAAKNAGILPAKATARLAGFAAGAPELSQLAKSIDPSLAVAREVAEITGLANTPMAGTTLRLTAPAGNAGSMDIGKMFAKAGINPAHVSTALGGTETAAEVAARVAQEGDKYAGQALSGLAGFGLLPFSHPSTILGTGDGAKAFAGYLSKKADGMLYGKVGTAFSRMFDSSVHGTTTAANQRVAREYLTPGIAAGEASGRELHLELGHLLSDNGLLDHGQSDKLRRIVEGFEPASNPGEQAIYDRIKALNQQRLAEATALGRPQHSLGDLYAEYGYRQQTLPKVDSPGYSAGMRRELDPNSLAQQARQETLKHVPGGTSTINQIAKDAHLRAYKDAGQDLLANQHVRQNYLGFDPATEQRLFDLNGRGSLNAADRHELNSLTSRSATLNPAEQARLSALQTKVSPLTQAEAAERENLRYLFGKGEALADWHHSLDPVYAKEGLDFFGNHPLTDFTLGQLQHNRAQAGAKALHELVAGNLGVAKGADTISAREALNRLGLGYEWTNGQGQLQGGRQYLVDLLKQKDAAKYATATIQDLDQLHLPANLIDEASKFSATLKTPEAVAPIVKLWDSITNLTKAGQTSLWPSFHSRNMVTGFWQNLVGGARDSRYGALDPRAWLKPYQDAMAVRNNGVIEGAAQIFAKTHPGIDDAQATKMLIEEMFQHSTRISPYSTQAGEAIGKGTLGAPVPLNLPGTGGEKTIAEVLNPVKAFRDAQAAGNGSLNPLNPTSMLSPLNVRGVGSTKETGNILVKGGQELGSLGDDLNRISAHIAYRRQGVDAAEAAARSRGLHYDYTKLTDFEREVMRRVLPFYSWTRQNVPFQLAELAHRPGGLSATAVKGIDSLRQGEGFVPESVSEGLAIPMGTGDSGAARYLTHLGLPIEDVASIIGTGANPIQRTGEKLLGMANPIIKMPAELIAGKQFYSGRQLDDLYSRTGNPLMDQFLMNSPVQRVLSTGGQLLDPRKTLLDKAANFLGPAKVADVDTEKAKSIAARDFIDKTLKAGNSARSFETLYVPPDQVGNLSPQEMQLYRLYKYMEQQRQAQTRERKKAAP